MPTPRSQRSGRKNNNERIRELVSLMGSLSRTGDSVSIDAISSRLGISKEDAAAMMDIVCEASGEEWGGLLISSNDAGTEFTLQYPGTHGRPLRFTEAETIAVVHALDLAGIAQEDPLRQRLREAFWSQDVSEATVRMALGSLEGNRSALLLCARSLVEERSLTFSYQGAKDAAPRMRRAVAQKLVIQDEYWYVYATDLDLMEQRTFRVDRITNVSLGAPATPLLLDPDANVQYVRITFTDLTYYTMFDWPGLKVLRRADNKIIGQIPYYGSGSTWLLRRICAGNGRIIVEDECIMTAARNYAKEQLLKD